MKQRRPQSISVEDFLEKMRRDEGRFLREFGRAAGRVWTREHPERSSPFTYKRTATREELTQKPREWTRNHSPLGLATRLPEGAQKRDGRPSTKFRPYPNKK
jgi:hypothetical protein